MSDLKFFLKGNKKEKETVDFAPTKSLCDDKGNPVKFKIKALSTKENDAIREACTYEVPVKGKPNMYRTKMNTSLYIAKMIASSVVFPDLNNKELQDSYGVTTPEELIKEIVDTPAEYDDFAKFVQQYNGFDVSLAEKVDEAKN